jgi:hypothetical protein
MQDTAYQFQNACAAVDSGRQSPAASMPYIVLFILPLLVYQGAAFKHELVFEGCLWLGLSVGVDPVDLDDI